MLSGAKRKAEESVDEADVAEVAQVGASPRERMLTCLRPVGGAETKAGEADGMALGLAPSHGINAGSSVTSLEGKAEEGVTENLCAAGRGRSSGRKSREVGAPCDEGGAGGGSPTRNRNSAGEYFGRCHLVDIVD